MSTEYSDALADATAAQDKLLLQIRTELLALAQDDKKTPEQQLKDMEDLAVECQAYIGRASRPGVAPYIRPKDPVDEVNVYVIRTINRDTNIGNLRDRARQAVRQLLVWKDVVDKAKDPSDPLNFTDF